MAQSTAAPTPVAQPAVTPLPLKAIAPWAVFFGVLMLVLLYFDRGLGAEQGATAVVSGEGVHECAHDARHLLGFPCH
ncbi:CbtB-domain containing protein [Streptomyces sp. NPDC005811]|uniref:CbtB-domain containing protein n=1 Tax=Streptomyces sp. NPDC005811 TaxID=3154565 RepID=UPI0033E10432